jgi:hypothetical protein
MWYDEWCANRVVTLQVVLMLDNKRFAILLQRIKCMPMFTTCRHSRCQYIVNFHWETCRGCLDVRFLLEILVLSDVMNSVILLESSLLAYLLCNKSGVPEPTRLQVLP